MRTQNLIYCLLLLVSYNLQAQKEANKWYFGTNAALDFNSGSPVVISPSSMNQFEGCTSMADANGDLLFYSDGQTIWNKNHNTMANGTGLLGNNSSTQSVLAVRQPGSSDLFYVFTTDGFGGGNGFSYSIVDMTLNGGLGGVTTKNVQLYTPTSERVAACRHGNGIDLWIMSHDFPGNSFYAYQLTPTGIINVPVITSMIPMVNTGIAFLGGMKFSPNAARLAFALGEPNQIWLYDFDNLTGIPSNPQQLDVNFNSSGSYSVEFSPDAKILYGSDYNLFEIYQYDLTQPTTALINSTKYTIVGTGVSAVFSGTLQLAPDAKIYWARNPSTHLAAIENPNVLGVGCNYNDSAIFLGPTGSSQYGLPCVSAHIFQFIDIEKFCLGDTTLFTAYDSVNYVSFQWNFDDPGSGPNNFAYTATASHVYTAPGNYNVQLIRAFLFAPFSDTTFFPIEIKTCSSVIANLSCSDTLFCDKKCIDFYDQSQFNPTSWQWTFTGASPSSSTDQNPTGICYNNYGAFDVQLIACNAAGCDTVLFTNFINEFQLPPQPTITSSNDTLYCNATNVGYAWFNVNNPNLVLSTDSFFVPTIAGQYYVVITDSNSCAVASTVFTSTVSLPELVNGNPFLFYNSSFNAIVIKANSPLSKVIIYDEIGREIKRVMYNLNSGFETIEMPLYQGVCFVKLETQNSVFSYKLIIQK
ncbi:MAG: PKD domain-containing protein [Bacteroidetes bacterium]|nr:PKD domain-containing protein [Bacteroidota bacterium]